MSFRNNWSQYYIELKKNRHEITVDYYCWDLFGGDNRWLSYSIDPIFLFFDNAHVTLLEFRVFMGGCNCLVPGDPHVRLSN